MNPIARPEGFRPAPPTAAEIEADARRERQRYERAEQDRVNQYDVTRGEFEEIEKRVTELEAKLAKL